MHYESPPIYRRKFNDELFDVDLNDSNITYDLNGVKSKSPFYITDDLSKPNTKKKTRQKQSIVVNEINALKSLLYPSFPSFKIPFYVKIILFIGIVLLSIVTVHLGYNYWKIYKYDAEAYRQYRNHVIMAGSTACVPTGANFEAHSDCNISKKWASGSFSDFVWSKCIEDHESDLNYILNYCATGSVCRHNINLLFTGSFVVVPMLLLLISCLLFLPAIAQIIKAWKQKQILKDNE
jgi:hypothetical protein